MALEPSPATAGPDVDPAAAVFAAERAGGKPVSGLGPWQLAWRRLKRNRVALASTIVFVMVAVACLAAPLYSEHVAHVGPNENNLSGTVERGGKRVEVVSADGLPIGPALSGRYLLGADGNGRDVMVRMLYGGRNSLFIAITAAIITSIIATLLGLLSGYFRGKLDAVIRGYFDIAWSFPVVLLGIALGTALAVGGLHIGPLSIAGDSLWIPTLILAGVYIPYVGRPIRGQVLALREKEFVEAAVAQGMSTRRILLNELLPNLGSTILVFSTLIVANNLLTESALSYLGAGVQAPNPSWGSLIDEGIERLPTAIHLTIAPGIAVVLTVLSLNLLGDAMRDALDPRAKVKIDA